MTPEEPQTSATTTSRPPSRGRRRVLALLTALLPLALLALLEGGLRLGGFGDSHPLFVPSEDEGHLVANSRVVRRFLGSASDIPKLVIRPVPFERVKAPDTLRVVVQGGSTAAGYPYGYGASPAGMLQQRLQRTFPDRRVEVVTTAVAAVNSYALLDFLPEILAQDPDLVVIYAGHNEYLGILGVGSKFSVGRSRPLVLSYLRLKDLRLLQLGHRLLGALRPEAERRPGETLMSRIAAEDRIPYGSDLYHRGLEQYRANLEAVLARYREAGVPVYVGTLTSNERHQPPFVSGHREGVDDQDRHAFRRHLVLGRRALALHAAGEALEHFDTAVAVDGGAAEGHFARGKALDALERFDQARGAYLRARDLDQLRFRAPGAMNEILRRVASEQAARVVEVEEAFRTASLGGIVGAELMLEHLHPNLDGYFEMADAFYRALEGDRAFGLPWTAPVPREQARGEIPVTEVDRLYGEYRIGQLTSDWPFSEAGQVYRVPEPRNRVERIARGLFRGTYPWPEAMRRLLDHHRAEGETEKAAKVATLLADAFPYRPEYQETAADLLERIDRGDSKIYQRRAGGDPRSARN